MFYIDVSRPPVFSNFGRFIQEKTWEHNGRSMEVNLLVAVVSGQAVFRYGGADYAVRRGDAVVIPKGSFYTAHTDSFCEYYYIHFSGDLQADGEGETAFTSLNGSRESLEALAEEPERWLRLPSCQALGSRLEDAMGAVRGRFGKGAIQRAGFLGNDLGLEGSGNKLEDKEN